MACPLAGTRNVLCPTGHPPSLRPASFLPSRVRIYGASARPFQSLPGWFPQPTWKSVSFRLFSCTNSSKPFGVVWVETITSFFFHSCVIGHVVITIMNITGVHRLGDRHSDLGENQWEPRDRAHGVHLAAPGGLLGPARRRGVPLPPVSRPGSGRSEEWLFSTTWLNVSLRKVYAQVQNGSVYPSGGAGEDPQLLFCCGLLLSCWNVAKIYGTVIRCEHCSKHPTWLHSVTLLQQS